jgi:hypothetical protein
MRDCHKKRTLRREALFTNESNHNGSHVTGQGQAAILVLYPSAYSSNDTVCYIVLCSCKETAIGM